MSGTTYRLVYKSRSRGADLSQHDLERILEISRRNNAAAGVCGALVFTGDLFGQVLEGPLEAVEATFERIQLDERHTDVEVIAFEPAPTRRFGRWSMAFVGSDEEPRLKTFGERTRFDPADMKADELTDALYRMVRDSEPAG